MRELLAWLEMQGVGLAMHAEFRRRARALGETDPEHAALLYLLAGLSRRFASFFDDVALPAHVAQEARGRLLALLRDGIELEDAAAELRLDYLNRVATSNLLIEARAQGAV